MGQASVAEGVTTVLAPGANVYHYDHMHVDLMRRASGRHVCEPTAISGEAAAARARGRYAARDQGDPVVTGTLRPRSGHGAESGARNPTAIPGED
jgi:hypothetical protein